MCFFWGTTYLGIRVALESFSPALLMCLRYSLSGGVLLIGARLAGARFPNARDLRRTAFYGVVTIGIGTGEPGLQRAMGRQRPGFFIGLHATLLDGRRRSLDAGR